MEGHEHHGQDHGDDHGHHQGRGHEHRLAHCAGDSCCTSCGSRGDRHHHQPAGKRDLLKMAVAALLLGLGLLWPGSAALGTLIFVLAWLAVGAEVLAAAVRELLAGSGMHEEFLMSIASLGAFAVGEYPEAVMVMLLFQVGEALQGRALAKSRGSIAALMDMRPDHVNLLDESGGEQLVAPEGVLPGQLILIRPGERIPLDSLVVSGSADVDTSALTGESLPRPVSAGDRLISGCVNLNGLLTARVEKAYGASTVSRILELTEHAAEKKTRVEGFITRFARIYTPVVVAAAALLAVAPPLLFGQAWGDWLYRACTLLVISCPCALVISVPLAFFAGIGGAGRGGVLVKGGNYLEVLSRTKIALFDKTGTLTEGRFRVSQVLPASGYDREELLRLAASAEYYSPHPLAGSLRAAYGKEVDGALVSAVTELPGFGLKALVGEKEVQVGNDRLMAGMGLDYPALAWPGSRIHVAADGVYLGCILVEDGVKAGAAQAVADLKRMGIATALLSGDHQAAAERVGQTLGLDQVYAGLLPQDKVAKAEALLLEKAPRAALAYIGDGVNDAPVLARADVGIAMGKLGSDAAIEAADIVVMNDDPQSIPLAIRHARRVMAIARQNIAFSLGVKAVILILGVLGLATMWLAVFADVGVALLAVANAMRCLGFKKS